MAVLEAGTLNCKMCSKTVGEHEAWWELVTSTRSEGPFCGATCRSKYRYAKPAAAVCKMCRKPLPEKSLLPDENILPGSVGFCNNVCQQQYRGARQIDPYRSAPTMTATKHDVGKTPLHLLPFMALKHAMKRPTPQLTGVHQALDAMLYWSAYGGEDILAKAFLCLNVDGVHKLIESVGLVLAHGAQEYGEHNWRLGMKWSRLQGAALRHLNNACRGEELAADSKLPHAHHAACTILMLLEYQLGRIGEDDVTQWQYSSTNRTLSSSNSPPPTSGKS